MSVGRGRRRSSRGEVRPPLARAERPWVFLWKGCGGGGARVVVAGRVCVSADDFVAAIEAADDMVNSSFDSEVRAMYESRYSFMAAKTRIESIMSA